MLLLALETSSLAGSVALFENDVCRAVAEFRNGREQGREVLLQSGKLLEKFGASPSTVDVIGVGSGPGSYTGIRVGVTAAKTLSLALRRPLLDESSLRVMAVNGLLGGPDCGSAAELPGSEQSSDRGPRFIATMLDGRQTYLYGALFRVSPPAANPASPDSASPKLEPGVLGAGDLGPGDFGQVVEYLVRDRVGEAGEFRELFETCLRAEAKPAPVTVIGSGAELFLARTEAAGGGGVFTRGPPAWDNPRAEALGKLLAARLGTARFDAAATHGLNPAYLRPTEAQRKLLAK